MGESIQNAYCQTRRFNHKWITWPRRERETKVTRHRRLNETAHLIIAVLNESKWSNLLSASHFVPETNFSFLEFSPAHRTFSPNDIDNEQRSTDTNACNIMNEQRHAYRSPNDRTSNRSPMNRRLRVFHADKVNEYIEHAVNKLHIFTTKSNFGSKNVVPNGWIGDLSVFMNISAAHYFQMNQLWALMIDHYHII